MIIGNMNAITYREVFPLLKNNFIWLGATGFVTDMVFGVPEGTEVKESDKKKAERLGYVGSCCCLLLLPQEAIDTGGQSN